MKSLLTTLMLLLAGMPAMTAGTSRHGDTSGDQLYHPECRAALGMQSGEIPDSAIVASSSFEISVGPHNARIRTETNGGAWCPVRPINREVHEFLEVELGEVKVVTVVETQGRFGNGQGREYASHFKLEYQREDDGPWIQYQEPSGGEILQGNVNTYTPKMTELHPPVIARKIRFVPYSNHPQTICMRVEVYGCPWKGITCEAPEAPEHGSVRGSDFTYYAQVTFLCSVGYILRGFNHAQCMEEGWDVETPTCKERTCEEISQLPDQATLKCYHAEDTEEHICLINCEDTYSLPPDTVNYITCGSDTDFVWSHQMMNRSAKLPGCAKRFFPDVILPIKRQYHVNDSCSWKAPIVGGHINAKVQEIINSLELCEQRCRVHDLSTTCVADQQTGQIVLQVDLNVVMKNPEENAVTGCDGMHQNMRQIISDAFTLKNSIDAIVRNEPDQLQLSSDIFQPDQRYFLCQPGRVYTRNGLCVPCFAGFHLPERSMDTCIPCPIGTYQDQQGQTLCKPCLSGSSTPNLGADRPDMCG